MYAVLELFRLNYERLAARGTRESAPKPQGKVEVIAQNPETICRRSPSPSRSARSRPTSLPEASVRTPLLNAELERRFAQLGAPPKAAQLTGVSVTMRGDRIEAELEYTEPDPLSAGAGTPS
jgi:hypothetical protein